MDKDKAVAAMEKLLNEAVKKGIFGDAVSVVYAAQAVAYIKTMEPPTLGSSD